jgi:hypothetical protein
MSKDELCQYIEESFSDAPKPAPGTLSLPTYDDEGTNAFFGGTDWRSHTVLELRQHDFALTVFTPIAFRYYLPAFLLCSIRHPEEADIIPEHIVSDLRRDISSDRARIQALSKKERSAVARFLEWLRDEEWQPDPEQRDEFTSLVHALKES